MTNFAAIPSECHDKNHDQSNCLSAVLSHLIQNFAVRFRKYLFFPGTLIMNTYLANTKPPLIWLWPFLFSILLLDCRGQGQELAGRKTRRESSSFALKQKTARAGQTVKPIQVPEGPMNFRDAARRSTLATVKIKSVFLQQAPLRVPDFYYEFFNKEYVSPYVLPTSDSYEDRTGSASGVLISDDGYIVTNYHVINGADKIDIILSDRRSYAARVVGTDNSTDLALLKINANSLPFLDFGNSDSVAIGDIALIVGNPLSFTSTVTQGIISFKSRNIAQSTDRWTLQSYLQTDGVVNIGNSGGALVDVYGRLIGIVAAIASPNGVYAGYSFAIPVEVVKKTADDLLNYGQVRRGSFGMKISEMDAEKAGVLNTPVVAGILIDSVETGGAAHMAGLISGDIITKIEGHPVESRAQLSEFVARSSPGQRVRIGFIRNGKQHKTYLTLQDGSIITER